LLKEVMEDIAKAANCEDHGGWQWLITKRLLPHVILRVGESV